MIGPSPILPVMLMVGNEMRIDAGLAELLDRRIVERLQRSPAPVQEIIPPGMQFPPGRHAGHAPDVAVAEYDGALGKALKLGSANPVRPAVRREHMPVKRIEHDHDGFHKWVILSHLMRWRFG
ncbi:hypothetical protein D3C73_1152850 [compost metagenome]